MKHNPAATRVWSPSSYAPPNSILDEIVLERLVRTQGRAHGANTSKKVRGLAVGAGSVLRAVKRATGERVAHDPPDARLNELPNRHELGPIEGAIENGS